MESSEEVVRLDVKTNSEKVTKQALWAGIRPGMRVADLGCGSGKTSYALNQLVKPSGEVLGIDFSEQRINYAESHYQEKGLKFHCRDIRQSLKDLGGFDFVWIRFVLEYYRADSYDIVESISKILNPNGILCLIDLDYNCLTYYGISTRLQKTISDVISLLEKNSNFDPYVGRKLYSYLYDLEYTNINVNLEAHHLIYGNLNKSEEFNWSKKVEVAGKRSGYIFSGYKAGEVGFYKEFMKAFSDPRRFVYTPLISCRGQKPAFE